MRGLKLIIGNKKYSSWSLRPWLAMKVKDIDFEEALSRFDMATLHEHYWAFSPTRKVPVLVHNDTTIWDSLAILEYLAECYPETGLWPSDRLQRAHARSLANEMHAGFPALRNECPMNMNRTPSAIALSDEALVDIKRIETIWAGCLDSGRGPFLFGEFTIADAMFAPVVNRIDVYKIPKIPAVEEYCDSIRSLPAWLEWEGAGKAEPWICENVEV